MTHSPSPPSNGQTASLIEIGRLLARIEAKADRLRAQASRQAGELHRIGVLLSLLTSALLTWRTSTPTGQTCPTSTAPTTPASGDGPPITKELLWPLARWLSEKLAGLIASVALAKAVPAIGIAILLGRKIWDWLMSWLTWLVGLLG